jgi:hypothetical protein
MISSIFPWHKYPENEVFYEPKLEYSSMVHRKEGLTFEVELNDPL